MSRPCKPLDEGLAKVPANPWLSTRKALIQLQLNQFDGAKATLRDLAPEASRQPAGIGLAYAGGSANRGPGGGGRAVSASLVGSTRRRARRARGRGFARRLGAGPVGFLRGGAQASGACRQTGRRRAEANSPLIRSLRTNPAISLWEKNPYRLWPAPEQATEPFRESFERAWDGPTRDCGRRRRRPSSCWRRVPVPARSPIAIGACAACGSPITRRPSRALRRYIARTGPTLDAVELECLCQKIDRGAPFDQVEFVHLSWPIRNRDGLLAALRGNQTIDEGPPRPLDPNDPESRRG